MKITGKAQEQISKLVEEFKTGNVAKSVAEIVINNVDIPSGKWSLLNRWISYVQTGDMDCRGFKQWQQVDRKVKAGQKAAYILRPNIIKKKSNDNDTEKEESILIGFGSIPVFGLSQTEGKEIDYKVEPNELPTLYNVAISMGLKVQYGLFNGKAYGMYNDNKKTISLCTYSEQTFLHELSHAAHSRIKNGLKNGQNPKQEIVAEFCACILARMYGKQSALEGNTYRYIEGYAKLIKKSVNESVLSFMSDIVKVIDFITKKEQELSIAA